MAKVLSEADSNQVRHRPRLIKVFSVHIKKQWILVNLFINSGDSDRLARMRKTI